jgi:hypothetical protein
MLGKLGAVILGNACFLATAAAAAPRQEGWIKVFIPPECKEWIYGPPLTQEDAQKHPQDRPDYVLWNPAMAKPMAYRDSRTSISFYVESDGRHIAAINSKGTLLWVRNPFEDAKLCPYRNGRPSITSMKATELSKVMIDGGIGGGLNLTHKFLEVTFDSTQYGALDESTGDFLFWGEN